MQGALARRVGDVGAAGEDRDRGTADLQRPRVGGRVDAERHAADDRDAGRRETAAEPAGDLQPVDARAARTDDRDGWGVGRPERREPPRVAGDVQDRRRVVGVEQPLRIGGVVAADHMHRHRREAFARPLGVEARERAARRPRGALPRAPR